MQFEYRYHKIMQDFIFDRFCKIKFKEINTEETKEMPLSLHNLRDKVMLAHAWFNENIDLVSILVFTMVASYPA
jgi:hypothetical protein